VGQYLKITITGRTENFSSVAKFWQNFALFEIALKSIFKTVTRVHIPLGTIAKGATEVAPFALLLYKCQD